MKQIFAKKYFKFFIAAFLILCATVYWWKNSANNSISSYRFTIARDPLWSALHLKDKRINMTTFTNELMVFIAKDQGLRFDFTNADPATYLSDLKEKDYDLLMIPADPKRFFSESYLLSNPIYRTGSVLVMRIDDDMMNLGKDKGHILAIPKENSHAMKEILNFPNIQVKPYGTIRNALEDLVKNKVDAVYIDAITAYTSEQGPLRGKIKVVGEPVTGDAIYIISLNNPRGDYFIKKFNKGLKRAQELGVYKALMDKWRIVDTRNIMD